VKRIVLLDESPLAAITHPSSKGDAGVAKTWYAELRAAGITVRVPQIADYELRRQLILKNFLSSIALLNQVIRQTGGLVPIKEKTFQHAAKLWAQRRKNNEAARDDKSLDGDMILCAQAWSLTRPRQKVIVASSNIKHLKSFVECDEWKNITAASFKDESTEMPEA
jgi:hypothetical protein